MLGMDAETGKPIEGIEHVRQSVCRILQTKIGHRIQRREFGSKVSELVSAPGNDATRLRAVSLIASAIIKWEPRVKISYVRFTVDAGGRAVISVLCSLRDEVFETSSPLFQAA